MAAVVVLKPGAMPLTIEDDDVVRLVADLARRRGVSNETAVGLAVSAELARETVPLRARLAALRAANPLPARTGNPADKAFFDELSGTP